MFRDVDIRRFMKNTEGMVSVSPDPEVLSNKMSDENVLVCSRCPERRKEFGELFLTGSGCFQCPVSGGEGSLICLTEDKTLPQECPKRFEHLIAATRKKVFYAKKG